MPLSMLLNGFAGRERNYLSSARCLFLLNIFTDSISVKIKLTSIIFTDLVKFLDNCVLLHNYTFSNKFGRDLSSRPKTFCAISDTVASHKTLVAGLQTRPRFRSRLPFPERSRGGEANKLASTPLNQRNFLNQSRKAGRDL